MSGCCGGQSGIPPRYKAIKCPRCAGSKVRELSRSLSVAWYSCGLCGFEWQHGW